MDICWTSKNASPIELLHCVRFVSFVAPHSVCSSQQIGMSGEGGKTPTMGVIINYSKLPLSCWEACLSEWWHLTYGSMGSPLVTCISCKSPTRAELAAGMRGAGVVCAVWSIIVILLFIRSTFLEVVHGLEFDLGHFLWCSQRTVDRRLSNIFCVLKECIRFAYKRSVSHTQSPVKRIVILTNMVILLI